MRPVGGPRQLTFNRISLSDRGRIMARSIITVRVLALLARNLAFRRKSAPRVRSSIAERIQIRRESPLDSPSSIPRHRERWIKSDGAIGLASRAGSKEILAARCISRIRQFWSVIARFASRPLLIARAAFVIRAPPRDVQVPLGSSPTTTNDEALWRR